MYKQLFFVCLVVLAVAIAVQGQAAGQNNRGASVPVAISPSNVPTNRQGFAGRQMMGGRSMFGGSPLFSFGFPGFGGRNLGFGDLMMLYFLDNGFSF